VRQNFVDLMDVVAHAVLAHLDKNVAEVTVPVLPIALVANVEMMVAAETHVEVVLMVNPVKTECVLAPESEPVDRGFVVTTESEVHVGLALLVKDVVEEPVSVTMTVTRETVDQPWLMPVLSAQLKLVGLVLPDLLAAPVDNVLLSLLVM